MKTGRDAAPLAVMWALVMAATGGVPAALAADATPPPLAGLRLFFAPEQRASPVTDVPPPSEGGDAEGVGRAAGNLPAPDPEAGASAATPLADPGSAGRATVRGARGVQRIEAGFPQRGFEP